MGKGTLRLAKEPERDPETVTRADVRAAVEARAVVKAGDRIKLFAGEAEDGSCRVDETVRRDPELFVRWLERNEPETMYDDDTARIKAINRTHAELIQTHRQRVGAKEPTTPAALLAILEELYPDD